MADINIEKTLRTYSPFGFHVSRKAWEWLEISTDLARPARDAKFQGVRLLADRFNRKRYLSSHVLEPIHAGQLISVGVIVDILRYVLKLYCYEDNAGALERAVAFSRDKRGEAMVQKPPPAFVNLFPPIDVVAKSTTEEAWLGKATDLAPNTETATAEMILLSLAMINPAFRPFRVLFDDKELRTRAPYRPLVESLEIYFNDQPAFAPLGMTLFECLRAPMQAFPDSLEDQLNFIKQRWGAILPAGLLERLWLATDIIREEERLRGLGPGPNMVLEFASAAYRELGYPEPAAFSRDADWMSNVVLIAKSVYVWLDQLSKKYQRHIRYLNDIPNEELDCLARWGFTGLWLIGLWERSTASQTIKQVMGNPEAASSAYSLYDYTIAADLGGEEAYLDLRQRAQERGIRLASDMVPNHMGIYSRWIVEHPDWFLQLDYPPFPVYQYTGTDLCPEERITVQIEDGYWEHRDAAVVFKRIDQHTGDVRYIYHGNDGTSMPWNDTAQLNFTLPEVREAVIQTILHVARKFPIIRFDAAMTLAKKHFQRLWFPQPGNGGAIPSRAEHGMTREQFDAVFPKEFWREVVDRVAAEVPDTLLLAEAFWLMEGYFVRTLGMHRVYNSAFMNMLKMEDNSKYRLTVKNVLKFSPEVIKRFVNFMNNPDEMTAVEQFGRGDKYYGVAAMMVTMPGLPMIGHGQVEGFTEKYGMEYRRAYWDEQVDEEMVRRHERQIFPLMRRRRLFSGADNFAFYDFNVPDGWTDENVFAYSNRADDERGIILFNNAYNTARGRIHTSTPINVGQNDEEYLVQRGLGEALALNTEDNCYYIFRDYAVGEEFIRSGRELAEQGLFVELHAYQYRAFLDFREVHDNDGLWTELARRLEGRGVPDMEEAFREVRLEPILDPLRKTLATEPLRGVINGESTARDSFDESVRTFLQAVAGHTRSEQDLDKLCESTREDIKLIPLSKGLEEHKIARKTSRQVETFIAEKTHGDLSHVLIAWIAARRVGHLTAPDDTTPPATTLNTRLRDWLLIKVFHQSFLALSDNDVYARADALLTTVVAAHGDLLTHPDGSLAEGMRHLLSERPAHEYLQIHEHDEKYWLNKEQLERLLRAVLYSSMVVLNENGTLTDKSASGALKQAEKILKAADRAGYQVTRTIELLEGSK